ncbi:hypothetical protein EV144_1011500 [Flavobacterium sp. 270]|nr:hypothetical protein EV144_1011500 [Flavobacterium sp. 270]
MLVIVEYNPLKNKRLIFYIFDNKNLHEALNKISLKFNLESQLLFKKKLNLATLNPRLQL